MTVIYGKRSQAAFDTLHENHQKVLLYIKHVLKIDHSVLEGHRGEETQNEYFHSDPPRTTLQWPNSKHNLLPSLAVDVVPYVRIPGKKGGIHWHDPDPKIREAYYREMVRFATIYQLAGKLVFGFSIRWGGDWDRDWSVMDNRFNDYPHQELSEA